MLVFKSGSQKFIFGSPERNPALNPSLLKLSDCKVWRAKHMGLSDALNLTPSYLTNGLPRVPVIAPTDKLPGLGLLLRRPLRLGRAHPRLPVHNRPPRTSGMSYTRRWSSPREVPVPCRGMLRAETAFGGAMLFDVSHLRCGRRCFIWRQKVLPVLPRWSVAAANVGSFPGLPVPVPCATCGRENPPVPQR